MSDIDLVIFMSPLPLFKLPAPAAMVRGQYPGVRHGETVSARFAFADESNGEHPWGQRGGINAGVILLEPSQEIFERMLREVTCKYHPEHIRGNGPEQDYLSRFFLRLYSLAPH